MLQIDHSRFNESIFLLGNYEKRITVYSQQIRATNLIYSLFRQGVLTPKSRIAIIGAGVAGISTVSAAALLGVKKIHLFEKGGDIIPMWRSCTSRWIHPGIFNWPFANWEKEETELPILNWKLGSASSVVKQISSDWSTFLKYFENRIDLKIFFNTEAKVIEENNYLAWGKYGESEKFDLIFMAVGFGRDGKRNDENTSYWANDNVDVIPEKMDKYFLSGIGDGGMADLFRIRFKDFNLEILSEWLNTDEIRRIEEKVKEIEHELTRKRISSTDHDLNRFLRTAYKKIHTPLLVDRMRRKLRHDTTITLHSKTNLIYNINSFPLNRFLFSRFLSIQDPNFAFVFGTLNNQKELEKTGFSREDFKVLIGNNSPVHANKFISRHGPSGGFSQDRLRWIDESETTQRLRAKNSLDQTGRKPIYRMADFFLENPELKRKLTRHSYGKPLKPYVEAMAFFSKLHEEKLNDEIKKEANLAQKELVFPNKVFETEEDYLDGLMEILPLLEKGATIKAVCGNKHWSSSWVMKYFIMNYEAVKRGVVIHRIFLLQDGEKATEQNNTIEEQKENGIIVSKVRKEIGDQVMAENKVPSSFGFAIVYQPGIDSQVIVHDLSEDKAGSFSGVKLTSHVLVHFYERIWNSLYRDSDEYISKYLNPTSI